jgi:hypothetical protein
MGRSFAAFRQGPALIAVLFGFEFLGERPCLTRLNVGSRLRDFLRNEP